MRAGNVQAYLPSRKISLVRIKAEQDVGSYASRVGTLAPAAEAFGRRGNNYQLVDFMCYGLLDMRPERDAIRLGLEKASAPILQSQVGATF